MALFQLSQITTSDGLVHQGVFFKPEQPARTAILWIHGLGSTFYAHLPILEQFASHCQKRGLGLAAFNTRGHDIVTSIHKLEPTSDKGYTRLSAGASQEIFTDSVYDLEAGVQFLLEQGFDKVILIGHSTGANKAVYYTTKRPNPAVSAIVLTSPLSDRLGLPQEERQQKISIMKQLQQSGKGDLLTTDHFYYPITPDRFLSLFEESSIEDVFDYGDPEPQMKLYSQIKLPLLVVFGEADEHAHRPIPEIKSVFDSKTTSLSYLSVVIPDAMHSFGEREDVFAKEIMHYITNL